MLLGNVGGPQFLWCLVEVFVENEQRQQPLQQPFRNNFNLVEVLVEIKREQQPFTN